MRAQPRTTPWQLAIFLIISLAAAADATAAGGCTISSTGLAFGNYQPLTLEGRVQSVDNLSTASVSVTCAGIQSGGSYRIALGAGTHGPGDRISIRHMANLTRGGDTMAYNVHLDPGRQAIWGDGVIGTPITGALLAGDSSRSHTVYGRIPGGQSSLQAGQYGDSPTMTISYDP